jgi:hypothetical protein
MLSENLGMARAAQIHSAGLEAEAAMSFDCLATMSHPKFDGLGHGADNDKLCVSATRRFPSVSRCIRSTRRCRLLGVAGSAQPPKPGRAVRQSRPKSAARTFPAEKCRLRAASRRRSTVARPLQPLDRRTRAHVETFGSLSPRCAHLTALNTRSRSSLEQALGIPNPRKGESMHKDSPIYSPLGIPSRFRVP